VTSELGSWVNYSADRKSVNFRAKEIPGCQVKSLGLN
jgi:hypothetical protein